MNKYKQEYNWKQAHEDSRSVKYMNLIKAYQEARTPPALNLEDISSLVVRNLSQGELYKFLKLTKEYANAKFGKAKWN